MMSEGPHVIVKLASDISPDEACDTRARAWKFIFDTYRKKAAGQDNTKTKQKD